MSTAFVILLIANGLVSWKGFQDQAFFRKYMFHVDSILIRKDYKRIFMSGFLHANTNHLLVNMLSFFFFAPVVSHHLGDIWMVVLYVASLIGGNLLSLFIQRNNGDYSAIGASGAVSGIVFAAIALAPGMSLYLFFIPIPIPAYLYGLAYMLYSINGIRKQSDNIGHEAHLGGAIVGVLMAIFMAPNVLQTNFLTISLILVPVCVFIGILIFRPSLLIIGMDYERNQKFISRDDQYNLSQSQKQKRLDYLLDKINRNGMDSLSEEEREFLEGFKR
jgi:membrane associated rhomboid family serine protease